MKCYGRRKVQVMTPEVEGKGGGEGEGHTCVSQHWYIKDSCDETVFHVELQGLGIIAFILFQHQLVNRPVDRIIVRNSDVPIAEDAETDRVYVRQNFHSRRYWRVDRRRDIYGTGCCVNGKIPGLLFTQHSLTVLSRRHGDVVIRGKTDVGTVVIVVNAISVVKWSFSLLMWTEVDTVPMFPEAAETVWSPPEFTARVIVLLTVWESAVCRGTLSLATMSAETAPPVGPAASPVFFELSARLPVNMLPVVRPCTISLVTLLISMVLSVCPSTLSLVTLPVFMRLSVCPCTFSLPALLPSIMLSVVRSGTRPPAKLPNPWCWQLCVWL